MNNDMLHHVRWGRKRNDRHKANVLHRSCKESLQPLSNLLKRDSGSECIFHVSGPLYVPYSAAITSKIRHIFNFNPTIPDLQLASAAAGFCAFMVPATLLAAMTFRDYGPELTQ